MYTNVGKKIKRLARVVAVIGIVISVISGISMIYTSFLSALIIAAIGSLFSWLSTLVLYGFGELIENVSDVKRAIMNGNVPSSSTASAPHTDRGEETSSDSQKSDEEIYNSMLRNIESKDDTKEK